MLVPWLLVGWRWYPSAVGHLSSALLLLFGVMAAMVAHRLRVYRWDDVTLSCRGLRQRWSVTWSDVTACSFTSRTPGLRCTLARRDGSEQVIALHTVGDAGLPLVQAILDRVPWPVGSTEGGPVELPASRDMQQMAKVAVVFPWVFVAMAVALWPSAQADGGYYSALFSCVAALVVGIAIEVGRRTVGWSYVIGDDGATRTRGGAELHLAWPEVRRVELRPGGVLLVGDDRGLMLPVDRPSYLDAVAVVAARTGHAAFVDRRWRNDGALGCYLVNRLFGYPLAVQDWPRARRRCVAATDVLMRLAAMSLAMLVLLPRCADARADLRRVVGKHGTAEARVVGQQPGDLGPVRTEYAFVVAGRQYKGTASRPKAVGERLRVVYRRDNPEVNGDAVEIDHFVWLTDRIMLALAICGLLGLLTFPPLLRLARRRARPWHLPSRA